MTRQILTGWTGAVIGKRFEWVDVDEHFREKENAEEDGEMQNMLPMEAEGDGNAERVKAGVWAGSERWDFNFMLITSKEWL